MKNIINKITKITKILKREAKYLRLKNLDPEKYESFLKQEYKNRMGENLNLENPKKYTEKMQYAKLYRNSPLKTKLTDKYLVREWIEEKIGSEFLIPLLGVWDRFSDINFDNLPDRFILKTNHSSGWNLIVNDKEQVNYKKAKRNFDMWLNKNFAYNSDLQLHYKDINPKVIAEEFIQDSNGELNDYKFICFHGKPFFCWVDIEQSENHYRNVYNMDWEIEPWNMNIYENYPEPLPKPKNFEKMIEIAETLSQGFSHVRVDLYNLDGKIYFGEMTFTSSSGYTFMYPKEYNKILGDLWDLNVDK